ncbi:energy transducer TonB [Pelagerythrobacter marensis]|uniref:TonB C-terminal domain-containing protein n=1 Tax=Pelagerythrobacter marensis TaxID=543877 RepID=A0A0G3X9F9_9SPHN|nr:TonB family protein [Pelagerythrobacter marensis]AKM07244.1 hypothetical protein AM2010_1170 [Pelagerythrobacter marensis]
MAYTDSRSRNDRIKSVAGVVAVHGALGYALLVGLQATGVIEQTPRLTGETVTSVPIPPEPEPVPPSPEPAAASTPTTAPPPPIALSDARPDIEVVDIELPPIASDTRLAPLPVPSPAPSASLGTGVEPVVASPRNDPSRWVTQADYRSSWINRELTGVARFRLDVGADGRVRNCTITGSSGHAELDRATCDLVTRRARFDAARNAQGTAAAGSYANAVAWQIPD